MQEAAASTSVVGQQEQGVAVTKETYIPTKTTTTKSKAPDDSAAKKGEQMEGKQMENTDDITETWPRDGAQRHWETLEQGDMSLKS